MSSIQSQFGYLLLTARLLTRGNIDAENNAIVGLKAAIEICRSVELRLGSLDPVFAEVLSLVVASDLLYHIVSVFLPQQPAQSSERLTAQSHFPLLQWKSWKRRLASASTASLGVTFTPSLLTETARQLSKQASSEVHCFRHQISLSFIDEVKRDVRYPDAQKGCQPKPHLRTRPGRGSLRRPSCLILEMFGCDLES